MEIALLLVAPVVLAEGPQPKTKGEFKRIQTTYESKLAEAVKPAKADYSRALEKLERDAMKASDSVAAAAVRMERESRDLGDAPLVIPNGANSSFLDEFRMLRKTYEQKREASVQVLLSWCRTELERLERSFMERKDPVSAAAVHTEREAVSRPPLRILRASYGGGRRVDITLPLRKAIRFNRLEIALNNHLAGDPAPYQVKSASITYQFGDGEEVTVRFREGAIVKIP